jgi:preprotein translocase subunit SecG
MSESREYLIDRIELFLRRTLIILALFFILYLIIFKWIGIGKKSTKIGLNEDIAYSAVKSYDKKNLSNIIAT